MFFQLSIKGVFEIPNNLVRIKSFFKVNPIFCPIGRHF